MGGWEVAQGRRMGSLVGVVASRVEDGEGVCIDALMGELKLRGVTCKVGRQVGSMCVDF